VTIGRTTDDGPTTTTITYLTHKAGQQKYIYARRKAAAYMHGCIIFRQKILNLATEGCNRFAHTRTRHIVSAIVNANTLVFTTRFHNATTKDIVAIANIYFQLDAAAACELLWSVAFAVKGLTV